jgi:transcriptional regulator of arginine metabolism
MDKNKHLDGYILTIIQTHEVKEQSELINLLKLKDIEIPQATLSRKLKKLNIAKVAGIYKVVDYNYSAIPLVLKFEVSDFGIIVLHTYPGNASSLAYYIDKKYISFSAIEQRNSYVLGTIAGDDTVLLIVKNSSAVKKVISILRQDFPYLQD